MRGGDVDQFVRFLGIPEHDRRAGERPDVRSAHDARVHRLAGLPRPPGRGRGLAVLPQGAAGLRRLPRRRTAQFPDTPAEAFPSPERPYGIQNAYIQALADLGVVGSGCCSRRSPSASGSPRAHVYARRLPGARRARRRLAAAVMGMWTARRARRRRAARRTLLDRPRTGRSRSGRSAAAAPEARAPTAGGRSRAASRTGCAAALVRLAPGRGEAGARRLRPPLPRARRRLRHQAVRSVLRPTPRVRRRRHREPGGRPRGHGRGTCRWTTARFDLVLCTQVLEHVEDPDAAVRELHRVTRPAGACSLDARRPGLPPDADRLLALDAHRPRAAVRAERRLALGAPSRPAPARRPASGC